MQTGQSNALILYLIETPFNSFGNRAYPDQAALVRDDLRYFTYGNMIRFIPTLMDLTSIFIVLCTNVKVYLYNNS